MATNQIAPSLLVFGPQTRPSPNDLADLRHELLTNPSLSKAYAAAVDLPKFWERLLMLDADLVQVPAKSHLHEFVEWLKGERETPYCAVKCPITLTFLLNFLIQIKQYVRFLHSVDSGEAEDAQFLMLKRLRRGGVHGFCVGFLCAIVVSLSKTESELADNAVRALRLALVIGVYVDKDSKNGITTCISARWRHKQTNALETALTLLKGYPEVMFILGSSDTTFTDLFPGIHRWYH